MLTLDKVDCYYTGIQVLDNVTFSLNKGELVSILGRNGAGKTTTLKAIMGLVIPTSGSITLDGVVLSSLPAHEVPKQGVAFVPQGRRLFPMLSVRENLEMGQYVNDSGDGVLEWVLQLFPDLKNRLRQRAGTLSGGQQQMVAMARALCTQPRYLLLDEPSEGLMPILVERVLETVLELKQQDVGILLVEQKVDAALHISDRVLLLENGSIALETTPDVLAMDSDPLVRYVGIKR
ncbi:MAG: ABC transporter ATP-binding protein [Arenicellales bacterium]|nr:ABC transporter ATP-binding protein [Arenicellales bacterium]